MRGLLRWSIIVLATGCVDGNGPRLASVTPTAAGRNAQVTLAGTHLCGPTANCETAGGEVQIGLNPPVVLAGIVEYSDTSAVIVVPQLAEAGPTKIIVTVNESASNAIDFEVLP